MSTFDKLAEIFRSFPGIGPRQAKRFVYFLLSRDPSYLEKLATLIGKLKNEIVQCSDCFRYFQRAQRHNSQTVRDSLTVVASPRCSICADPNRATGELMVVAKDTDLEAIEKSDEYHGKYFVLGDTLALIEKKSTEKPHFKELLAVVHQRASASHQRQSASPLKEVILALSATTEGEYTADELRRLITPLLAGTEVKLTTLGRGLSTGSELEYADKDTLAFALKNRA